MGRHIIGYEVQKVLAAVDWVHRRQRGGATAPVGVAGYGEGGLVALYAAAADTRIDAALVSGYFDSRQEIWSEPIYHNVWGLLHEFGDAEIASLIAPRALIVEDCNTSLKTSSFDRVRSEFDRIGQLVAPRISKPATHRRWARINACARRLLCIPGEQTGFRPPADHSTINANPSIPPSVKSARCSNSKTMFSR